MYKQRHLRLMMLLYLSVCLSLRLVWRGDDVTYVIYVT